MKKVHRPALTFAGFAAALTLFGSTSYALTNGFTTLPSFLNVLMGSERILKDGGRIIALSTKDCQILSLDARAEHPATEDKVHYYHILSGSKLSSDDIAQMVQGECESTAATNRAISSVQSELTRRNPLNATEVITGGYMDDTIVSITPTSLTTTSEVPFAGNKNEPSYTKQITSVYDDVDPQVLVEESNGDKMSWNDLHVGDSIFVQFRTHESPEALGPEAVSAMKKTLVYVSRNSANITKYARLFREHYNDFEEVEPCTSTPDQFCIVGTSKKSPID